MIFFVFYIWHYFMPWNISFVLDAQIFFSSKLMWLIHLLPFTACHWLLIGPKYDACGFDSITGRPHKATAAKYSYGKGHLGSRYESWMASSWSLGSFFGFGLIGHFEVRSPVDFTMVAMKHSLNKDIKGCRERQKLRTQMLCKETLLRAAVTAFLKCHLF